MKFPIAVVATMTLAGAAVGVLAQSWIPEDIIPFPGPEYQHFTLVCYDRDEILEYEKSFAGPSHDMIEDNGALLSPHPFRRPEDMPVLLPSMLCYPELLDTGPPGLS